ncbi:hypothetical protein [Flavobacteriaceae bacterium 14752]|uniref:hypothetical protein n=1 Tax=Mesohalobacter salilacus TaxID=2491711 RepID=UPI000F643205|nr:hypothetical protein EIG84_05770 [Flavobacteriaceae bacterium 14752]
MVSFDKKDIPVLDFILKECLKKETILPDVLIFGRYLPRYKHNLYGEIEETYDFVEEFKKYLSILAEHEACECSFKDDAVFARKNENTERILDKGGFDKIYKALNRTPLTKYNIITIGLTVLSLLMAGWLGWLQVHSNNQIHSLEKKIEKQKNITEKLGYKVDSLTTVDKVLFDEIDTLYNSLED